MLLGCFHLFPTSNRQDQKGGALIQGLGLTFDTVVVGMESRVGRSAFDRVVVGMDF